MSYLNPLKNSYKVEINFITVFTQNYMLPLYPSLAKNAPFYPKLFSPFHHPLPS